MFDVLTYGTDNFDLLDGTKSDDFIFGFGGNDIIHDSGRPSNDVFFGGDGNDFIGSQHGSDKLFGEDGRDTLAVYSNFDNVYVDGGASRDTLMIEGTKHDFTLVRHHGGTYVFEGHHDGEAYRIVAHSIERVVFFGK